MAEVPGRMDLEGEYAKELAKLLRVSMGQLLELLGDPPNVANIPESYWRGSARDLFRAIERRSREIYLGAAQSILDSQPIGVDWGLVNERAAAWARSTAESLAIDVVSANRRNVGNAIATFFEEGLTMGDLRSNLSSLFGPTRAELIASTETTRASVQGELEVVRQLKQEGIEFTATWVTSRDERVCPICEPLDGVEESSAGGFAPGGIGPGIPSPPAHPRCRCEIAHRFKGRNEVIGG